MIIAIVGPTGIGKTRLSIMLAKKYNAIIINGDSCQIYKDLNIGTAKIKEDEKEGIKHYLFDIKKPDEEYSVSDYQNDLRNLLNIYKDRNIIIVGGTGLYLTAALYDYQFSKIIKKDYSNYSNKELYEMCKQIDKDCNIHFNNRIRMENYLNRKVRTNVEPKLLYDVKFIGLTTERNILYERINKRVVQMFQNGLVDEVKNIIDNYGVTNILKRAIGYKEVVTYLNNEINLDECIELIQKNSRHYAKRQFTWFNNKMNINWFNVDLDNFNNTYDEICKYIGE